MICPKCGGTAALVEEDGFMAVACRMCGYRKYHFNKGGEEMKEKEVCKIEGCENLAHAKGLCNKHYLRNLYEKRRKGKGTRGGREKKVNLNPLPDKNLSLMDVVNNINKYVRDTIGKDIQPLIDELKKNISALEAKLRGF